MSTAQVTKRIALRERDEEIVRLRTTGEASLKELSDRYGITVERVRQIAKGLGVDPDAAKNLYMSNRVSPKIIREKRATELAPQILMRWMAGQSVPRISREMNLNKPLVKAMLAETVTDEAIAAREVNTGKTINANRIIDGGQPTHPVPQMYSAYWTADRCWEALEGVARLHGGRLPRALDYRKLSRGKVMLPSFSTCRARLGVWSQVRVEVNRRVVEES